MPGLPGRCGGDAGTARAGGRLLGAADRLREGLGIVPTPRDRLDGRAAVGANLGEGRAGDAFAVGGRTLAGRAAVCARLGEDRAAEAFATGRTLPLAEAIAAARALAAELATAAPARPAPSGLTPRELDVLRLLAAGRSNREIAQTLSISEHTVEHHVRHVLSKLSLPSRTAAAAYAHTHGLA